jgi:hypothetical protein
MTIASADSAYDFPWPNAFRRLLSLLRVFLVREQLTETAVMFLPKTDKSENLRSHMDS